MAATPATRKQVTSAKDWRKPAEPLEVPSGNVALVRPVGMPALIRAGVIPNPLIGIIQKAMKAGKPFDPRKEDWTKEKLAAVDRLIDSVAVYCVVDPKVEAVPENDGDRDPDVLYVDDVDLDDKLFIYQFAVGGTRDLESFREGLASSLAALRNGGAVQRPAKQPPRSRPKR